MKLYSNPASPFVRKVRLVLAEAGLEAEIVAVAGNAVDPGTMPLGANPLGKIPALQLEDGRVLYDSRVICRFLDAEAGGRFYPRGADLWDVLVVEALADGIMDAAVLMAYEVRVRPEEMRFQPWIEGQWRKVTRALDEVERRWLPLLDGDFGMAAIAMISALGYLDLRHDARGWRAGRPGLAAWETAMQARSSVQATKPA